MSGDTKTGHRLWLSFGYFLLSTLFFIGGSVGYLRTQFIDYKLNTIGSQEYVWLILLFALPLLATAFGMAPLYMRARRDYEVARFYSFCLLLMSLSPIFYCLLWCAYVYDWPGDTPFGSSVLSWIALIVSLLLVLSVIYITYLIMWTPEKSSSFLQSPDDIKNWERFCKKLEINRNAAKLSRSGSLMNRLPEKVRVSIEKALSEDKFDALRTKDIVKGINELLKVTDLYRTQDLQDKRLTNKDDGELLRRLTKDVSNLDEVSLSEDEVQRVNRLLLEAAYPHIFVSVDKDDLGGGKLRSYKNRAQSEREELRNGLAKAPFWSMVFFFTLFLGITYLLGFAFAFHDRARVQASKTPALYTPRSPLFNIGEHLEKAKGADSDTAQSNSGGDNSPAATSQQSNNLSSGLWPEYVFYFDSYSASLKFNKLNDDEFRIWLDRKMKSEKRRRQLNAQEMSKLRGHEDWKRAKNGERLWRLMMALENEDKSSHGQPLLIELRGSADDSSVRVGANSGTSYDSNLTLSETRAQVVKHTILERLARAGNIQSNFQWELSPLSNEPLFIPASASELKLQEEKGNPTVDDIIIHKSARIEHETEDTNENFLQTKLSGIKKLFHKGSLSENEANSMLGKLDRIIDSMREYKKPAEEEKESPQRLTEEAREAQNEKRKQLKDDISESIEAVENEHVDKDANMRVVVVSIKPIQQGHLYAPLSLMDYMYFTIYTITTTGYGDIVPTTTYAKFLCSSANILEVFFFVVFFNGLLSMRRSKELDAPPVSRIMDDVKKEANTEATGKSSPEVATENSEAKELLKGIKKDVEGIKERVNLRWWQR